MTTDYRVAVEGFSTFERESLVSFFRLAEARTPSYGIAMSILDAHFIVADADDAGSVAAVIAAERVAETVFVGSGSPGDAMARLPRPVDPVHIVRELDALAALQSRAPTLNDEVPTTPMALHDAEVPTAPMALRDEEVTAPIPLSERPDTPTQTPAPAPVPPARVEPPLLQSVAPSVPPTERLRAATPVAEAPVAAAPPPHPSVPKPPPAGVHAHTPAEVLVVEDSDVAQRYLAHVLGRMGLKAVPATNSQEAMDLLAQHDYPLVLIDIMLGDDSEFDGLVLCQQIKSPTTRRRGIDRRRDGGSVGPRVVFVTALGNQSDRVRGSLAGGDAYLTKPLDEVLFARTLSDLMPSLFASPSSRSRPGKPRR